jgi:hypothetical protein
MDAFRRQFVNDIRYSISTCNSTITRIEESIRQLNATSQLARVQELKEKLASKKAELELLEKKETDASRGLYDHEIQTELDEQRSLIEAREKSRQVKNHEKVVEMNEKKNLLTKNREEKAPNYYREFAKYQEKCDTLPDWLLAEMERLPNNEGRIFRGIWCFGKRPVVKNAPQIMKESKNGVQLIHEYTATTYYLYEKKGDKFVNTKVVARKIRN